MHLLLLPNTKIKLCTEVIGGRIDNFFEVSAMMFITSKLSDFDTVNF